MVKASEVEVREWLWSKKLTRVVGTYIRCHRFGFRENILLPEPSLQWTQILCHSSLSSWVIALTRRDTAGCVSFSVSAFQTNVKQILPVVRSTWSWIYRNPPSRRASSYAEFPTFLVTSSNTATARLIDGWWTSQLGILSTWWLRCRYSPKVHPSLAQAEDLGAATNLACVLHAVSGDGMTTWKKSSSLLCGDWVIFWLIQGLEKNCQK